MHSALHTTPPAILIATLGTEAQVVTAALDLLLAQGESIHRVIVLHTVVSQGAISEAVNRLQSAFAEQPYAGKIFLEMQALCLENGFPLPDLETPDAAQAVFRQLYHLVRAAKQQALRVHLSIAGGRKTMAVYGMATAQLLFDEEDCLWHLYSSGDFLESKRLHPGPGDQVRLALVPVILWSEISPTWTHFAQVDDPYQALERVRSLRLAERERMARHFVEKKLTAAERRVVELLVRDGLSDHEIAERLVNSNRTIEQHLGSAYNKAAAYWDLPAVNRTQLVSLLNLFFALTGNFQEDTGKPGCQNHVGQLYSKP